MPTLKLSERTFAAPELGEDVILYIRKVKFDDKYGKAKVLFEDSKGGTCFENFNFGTGKKKPTKQNEVSLSIFSTLARAAFGDWKLKEIDVLAIEGKFVQAEVYAQTVEDDEGKKRTYYHCKRYRIAPETFDIEKDEDTEDDSNNGETTPADNESGTDNSDDEFFE